jgi:hypothetical protein
VGITHAQLCNTVFVVDDSNTVLFAMDNESIRRKEPQGKFLMNVADIEATEYLNLIHAAPVLYNSLTGQYACLQSLIDDVERAIKRVPELKPFLERHLNTYISMQNALMIAQAAAVNGVQATVDLMDRSKGR